ncbi:MAG: hypothetical protein Q8927_19020 [Bacteroidota bacterium]|nr:hypothetical protein [Bacteroidota bacterium]MDP4218299.1 hypothetical protein [Bacteroidota bacterium]MDP4248018.1 hypothetical protein [Bacteroidota bacterium]MDP4254094.1 hypothetical protein [Bacteroidota bacterium]MDP4260328.1 hypothetical protein [Bacteroidota bacterium]
MRYIIFICIIAISISSCYREIDSLVPHSKAFASLLTTDTPISWNSIELVCDQHADPNDSNTFYTLTGIYRDSTTHAPMTMGNIAITSPWKSGTITQTLTPSSGHTYQLDYDSSGVGLALLYAEAGRMPGAILKIKATGTSAADTVTQSIYCPKLILTHTSDFPSGQFSRLSSLTLKWVTDASNASGDVLIKVWYEPILSRALSDSTLPSTDTALTYVVADNLGTYTISSSDLQLLHVNSLVHITIGRGTEAINYLPLSGTKVYFFTSTSASTKLLTLTN